MTIAVVFYGCGKRTLVKEHHKARIERVEIKFLRAVSKQILHDNKTNEETREELDVYGLDKALVDYR
jgi:hypothetical protein